MPAAESVTAEIPGDPTDAMPTVEATVEAVETAEAPQEDTGADSKDTTVFTANAKNGKHAAAPWYEKITRSVGATVGVAVGALVVVGLTAGLSAFAGAQAGSFDFDHDRPVKQERVMPGYGQSDRDDSYGYDFDRDDDGYGYGWGQDGSDRGSNGNSGRGGNAYGYGWGSSYGAATDLSEGCDNAECPGCSDFDQDLQRAIPSGFEAIA